MSKESYELLKAEVPSIAEAIKLFPDELQERVFSLLVNTLLDQPVPLSSPSESENILQNPVEKEEVEITKDRNYVEEFKKFVEQKDPNNKLPDLEFAPLVAHFFIHSAPDEKKVKEINVGILLDGFRHAGRKPPKDPRSTLTNAKSKRGFLDTGSTSGAYILTPAGEYFVNSQLPKK